MIDYEQFLSQSLSRKEIDFVANDIHVSAGRMTEAVALLRHENEKTARHAAWALEKLYERYPEDFDNQLFDTLAETIIETKNSSIRRLILSILIIAPLPENLPMKLVNSCFEWMMADESPVAVKVLSIYYLMNVCKREPDLISELKLLTQQLLETTDSAGVRAATRKVNLL